jgi:type VI secretion system protein ImpH
MATESGGSGPTLDTKEAHKDSNEFGIMRKVLEEEPFRFQFFQAVRLLQRMERGREPVGYFVTPEAETVRFRSLPSLTFPASELYSLERRPDGQMEMTVQFMGICAAISVMPLPYTELLLQRTRENDRAMVDFFDIFNHRLISFFYRGWAKYRFFVGYENTQKDSLTPHLLDLLGLGSNGLQCRMDIPDKAFLNYIGLLGRRVRSADSIKQILEDYFGVPAEVCQFAGVWRKLQPENQTFFSGAGRPNEQLGVGVVVGSEVWDHHGRIRIVLGPVRLKQYLSFLPGEDAHRELCTWLRFFSNQTYETEVQLVLAREDVPGCELGADGPTRPQLGLVSWLKTKAMPNGVVDATYLVQ